MRIIKIKDFIGKFDIRYIEFQVEHKGIIDIYSFNTSFYSIEPMTNDLYDFEKTIINRINKRLEKMNLI